jgi:hypothetical protein
MERLLVGYFYSLANGHISAIDTIATTEAVEERVTLAFDSLQAYYFDGVQSTLASWAAHSPAENALAAKGKTTTAVTSKSSATNGGRNTRSDNKWPFSA